MTAFLTASCRYILPFSGGLSESGADAPVSKYPATTTGTTGTAANELSDRLAKLKAMQEEANYIPS